MNAHTARKKGTAPLRVREFTSISNRTRSVRTFKDFVPMIRCMKYGLMSDYRTVLGLFIFLIEVGGAGGKPA